jgi:hypothetical protein
MEGIISKTDFIRLVHPMPGMDEHIISALSTGGVGVKGVSEGELFNHGSCISFAGSIVQLRICNTIIRDFHSPAYSLMPPIPDLPSPVPETYATSQSPP